MRIVVITQEESFVIPANIERILSVEGVEVAAVIVLDATGSLINKKRFFVEGFGVVQSARMGLKLYATRFMDLVDRLSGRHILDSSHSIEAVARRHEVPFAVVPGTSGEQLLKTVRTMNPDLVVSFSAPVVFKPDLLEVPTHGCVNLHCSLLPHYAGLMPSFWTLYHGESKTGATVHFMDDRIDNGAILAQKEVPIDAGMSMFDLIRRTKRVGGELMVQVIGQIRDGEISSRPNRTEEGSYYSWPTIDQLKEFRRAGGRLI